MSTHKMSEIEQQGPQVTIGHIAKYYKGRDVEESEWRIPEHQRDYVWKIDRQQRLIDSIMAGFVIPPIMLHKYRPGYYDIEDGQQRVHTIHLYTRNVFPWKRPDGTSVYYNDLKRPSMNETERYKFNSHPLYTIQFSNATTEQIAEIFERLNWGKALSDNDKFWNRRNSPLVQEVINTIFDDYLDRIQAIFSDGIEFDRKYLSNAVGLMAGCLYGKKYITTAFICIYDKLQLEITPEVRERGIRRLERVLSLYESVDELYPYPKTWAVGKTPKGRTKYIKDEKKKKEQFTLGKFSAYYLYDLIDGDGERADADERDDDWRQFLIACRSARKYCCDNMLKGDGGGANNINEAKLKAGIDRFNDWKDDEFDEKEPPTDDESGEDEDD